jgi:protein-disulfide isomerase
MNMNRRLLLASVSALAFAPHAFAQSTGPVDQAALMAAPELGEIVLGKEDAPVTIIEYASASCPHCAAFAIEVMPTLHKDYIDTGKVRFIFREFPHNDQALAAFMLARCAPKEKYMPIMDVMFKTQEEWVQNPLQGLMKIALQSGFTEEKFNECLRNEKVAKSILDVRAKGETFGVTGIPTFFVNGVKMEGDKTLDSFKTTVEPLLPKT